MNSDGSKNLSLKHQRFTPSSCKDIGIKTFELAPKTRKPSSITVFFGQLHVCTYLKSIFIILKNALACHIFNIYPRYIYL